jgi:hypothetical protein
VGAGGLKIYCDESGGVGAGVMTLAAVAIGADAADAVLTRLRDVTGLMGELKGSRIDMAMRAFCIETVMRAGAQAVVAVAKVSDLPRDPDGRSPEDMDVYAALIETAVGAWLPASGGCAEVEIDDGRYDPRINGRLRGDVQATLGQWGRATLSDSRRSAGIQIADVIANSLFQIVTAGPRARRIEALLAPFIASGVVRVLPVSMRGG